MDLADLLGVLTGIAGVLVAIGALRVAVRANGKSREANRIAQEALDTQRLGMPPAWDQLVRVDRERVAMTNTSGRNIVVRTADVEVPHGAVVVFDDLPARVEYGDAFAFRFVAGHESPRVLTITWSFEGEAGVQTTERRF